MKKNVWRKTEREFYLPRNTPELIHVSKFKYAIIAGKGNPNNPHFADYISALYAISYAIKMNLKKSDDKPNTYIDYAVYPLEGVWDISDDAKKSFNGIINKDDLEFNLMIRQPDFVHADFFMEMIELTQNKKPNPLLNEVRLSQIMDGQCVQMMHLGSYDDEPDSFKLMEQFAQDSGRIRSSKKHREIYLTDFRKVNVDKLKTVLRFKVK